MIELKHPRDLARLRRLALSSQGLLQIQPYGSGLSGARKAISHLGYVQIDTISVIERAHHHVLHSRVPKFTSDMTNQMLLNGDIFEYWSHAAAFLPINDFRFSLPYKHAIKNGQTHWYKNPDQKLMQELRDRIRIDGPLRSRDLETRTLENKKEKRTGWWDWKPAKKALEQLYMQGDIMVSSREGFQKTYDLTERVLPSHVNSSMPSIKDFAEHMIKQQLRCHGFTSLKGLTYLRRNPELRKAVKTWVNDQLSQHTLEQIKIHSGEIFILNAGELEHPTPRVSNRVKILSPFDNSVIQRDRLKSVFQYDYQIECYVPEAKRQYGYFSLPLLYQDQFIGRMDCKAHRKLNHLEIKSLHIEGTQFDTHIFIAELAKAIIQFKDFQNCESVSVTQVNLTHLKQPLENALT
ncbi:MULTISPECIES: winged helix-turn-helix domain-containing protein [Vibrio]|uniref:Winged helix-turn-helix domain-containing protein n=1 Tax=Vibrio casei TaxID=673372 RepID=A0A368LIF7_9VIBR|nr:MULTISPECIES: crosslink repair DNA glycosylase YcaQ family protein [Vibrio]RCS70539.1 winged helix-turn-helix domain-containing protein [Vibrio casei]SJN27706.1 hypothetical protein FM109_07870 [Vibrio casei]HBV77864.1 winged helix-turn-helix domain-containing protein [Vibrio sp.]